MIGTFGSGIVSLVMVFFGLWQLMQSFVFSILIETGREFSAQSNYYFLECTAIRFPSVSRKSPM